jgi:hypothetical protein
MTSTGWSWMKTLSKLGLLFDAKPRPPAKLALHQGLAKKLC